MRTKQMPGVVPALDYHNWDRMSKNQYIDEVCRVMDWLGIPRKIIWASLENLNEPGFTRVQGFDDI